MIKNKTLLGYISAVLATLMWGSQPILIRYLIMNNVDTKNIVILKVWMAIAFLIFIIGLSKNRFKKWKIPNFKLFLLGIIGIAGNLFLFHLGLNYTSGSHAILIETFAPVFVLLLGLILLPNRFRSLYKSNKLKSLFFIIILGSIGSSLILLDKESLMSDHFATGDALVAASTIFFAIFFLTTAEIRKRDTINSIQLMILSFIGVGLILLPFINIGNLMILNQMQWILIAIIAIFGTALPFILWNFASLHLKIIPLSVVFNFTAIFTIILESSFLDLNITWNIILATIIILFTAFKAKQIDDRF